MRIFNISVSLFFLLFLFSFSVYSQGNKKSLEIKKTQIPVRLDGVLDEAIWQHAEKGTDFMQFFPSDTLLAQGKTEFMVSYDDKFLYFAAIVYDSLPGNYVSQSLRRDFRGGNADGITMILDPFQDMTNAFFFGLNPYGVQREGLIANGGSIRSDFDLSWDNKWFSEAKIYENYWIAEGAIPFTTLRYKEGSITWGINFYRIDSKYNERSIWSPIPRQFTMFNLAYNGEIHWDEPLLKAGANISLIPYTAARIKKNHLENQPNQNEFTGGGDMKFSITPSLNLDVTVNPDFSQVEVDEQQTNLDRFEIFFPERRQFFLENADLFSSFGFENARPFFSRRIGVAIDSTTGQNVQNQILGGIRLSGRLDENWRLGIMNMQTNEDRRINIPSYNYSVGAVQRRVFKRSNLSVIIVNKQNFNKKPIDVYNPHHGSFSRLAGIDYNLASADGKWTGKTYYHHSFDESENNDSYSHGSNLMYNTLNFYTSWTHQVVGSDFEAVVGFLPRNNFRRINPVVGYNFYPKSTWLNMHTVELYNNLFWNKEWGITDNEFFATWKAVLQSSALLEFTYWNIYVKLFDPFNPTGNSSQLFMPGESFNQNGVYLSFQSDQRKTFNYNQTFISGQFYNGNLRQFSGMLNYRYLQYATFSLTYNINRVKLTEGFDDATIFLIGPRLDITFNRDLFWTTFVQYNSQFNNINVNSRLQWRFKPVSDFFLVYTDNYFPQTLRVKNRALVAKLTYWMNL